MGGLGFILGGALQGIGSGMMQGQLVKDQERRDAALAKLRREENSANLIQTADLNDRNAARSDERELNTKKTILGITAENETKIASINAAAKRDAQESEQKFKERILRLESALDTDKELKVQAAKMAQEGNQLFDVKVDEDTGAISAIYKNGRGEIVNGAIARKRPTGGSSSDAPLTVGGAAGKPVAPTRGAQDAKTISRAQVTETAKATGMSEQQVIADAQRRGYTVK